MAAVEAMTSSTSRSVPCLARMDRGCVADQPQRIFTLNALDLMSALRLVCDTAAVRQ